MKIYTIEDLRNGLVHLYNPQRSVKAKEVLKAAFPCAPTHLCFGDSKYYIRYRVSNTYESLISPYLDIPTQHVDVFLKELREVKVEDDKVEFTIEDVSNGKCAVINDGTLDELNLVLRVAFPYDNVYAQGQSKYYQVSKYTSASSKWWWYDDTDLPSQSVKVFLKEINQMDNKKIIGYKLTKLEYENAAAIIAGFDQKGSVAFRDFKLANAGIFVEKLKAAGVLDLWFEPIYNTVKIFDMTSSSGDFQLEVSKEGIYYRFENAKISTDFLWEFTNPNCRLPFSDNGNQGNYVVRVTKVDVGCKKDTLVSQWQEVYAYHKSLKQ